MSLIEINWNPGKQQLRVFGFSALAASLVLAGVFVLIWGLAIVWAIAAVAAGAAILLTSLISPRAARIVYVILSAVGLPIGFVVSFVLLAAFYFLLLTPLALVFRLIGRDALHRRLDRTADSYWIPRKPAANLDRYFHQT
ncbi:MAG: hypothetical protein JW955_11405 [Sedimentisphaerales bacterium]|nr:hypothetical protein [Sedimentisphaerales bacterium]